MKLLPITEEETRHDVQNPKALRSSFMMEQDPSSGIVKTKSMRGKKRKRQRLKKRKTLRGSQRLIELKNILKGKAWDIFAPSAMLRVCVC